VGFGNYVAGTPRSSLLRDYDLNRGRTWGLFLLRLGVAPSAARAGCLPGRATPD
jgi:hypothetical protein